MTPWQCCLAVVALFAATGAAAQTEPLGTPVPARPLGTELAEERGPTAFLENQLTYPRVAEARRATDAELRQLFARRGVEYPAPRIYLRVFKHERVMELWARGARDSSFTLIREYPVCAPSGELGPKAKMGDFQVPEGFYFIDGFNPISNHHLSLRISYPNLADRIRREALSLGGNIFVHGGCQTVGCVPIRDDRIREVYWLAVQAMDAGQHVIPIHIFPSRLDRRTLQWLERAFQPDPELEAFWRNLAEGFAYFEATRRVPWITVAEDGRYDVPPFPDLATGPDVAPEAAPEAGPVRPVADPAAGATAGPDSAVALDAAGRRAAPVQVTVTGPATPDSAAAADPAVVPSADSVLLVPADSAIPAPADPAPLAPPDTGVIVPADTGVIVPDTAAPAVPDTIAPALPDTARSGSGGWGRGATTQRDRCRAGRGAR